MLTKLAKSPLLTSHNLQNSYNKALRCCQSEADTRLHPLLIDRSFARLEAGYFEAALADAEHVLSKDRDHELHASSKLYAASALYGMSQYSRANAHYKAIVDKVDALSNDSEAAGKADKDIWVSKSSSFPTFLDRSEPFGIV